MKTFIKIVLLSFLFFISFSGQSQAQSGKGVYGNTISRRQSGSRSADYITRGLRFNVDVCAGIDSYADGLARVTAGAGYQFSPYVYLGGVVGYGMFYCQEVIVATDGRVYFTKKRATPMLSAQLGYLLDAYNDFYSEERNEWVDGWEKDHMVYASCGIGARIYLTKKLGLTARFLTSTLGGYGDGYDVFLGLCVGIEF